MVVVDPVEVLLGIFADSSVPFQLTMKLGILFLVLTQTIILPDRVEVEPQHAVAYVGFTQQYSFNAFNAEGYPMRDAEVVKIETSWSTDESQVANINSDGKATALAPGTATILLQAGNVTSSATLEVFAPVVILEGTTVPLKELASEALAVALRDPEVRFTSDRRKVARIDDDAVVFGRSVGTTVVTALSKLHETHTVVKDLRETQIAVEVIPNPAIEYQIAQTRINIRVGDEVKFRVMAYTAQGGTVDGIYPVWSVSPDRGASIQSDGGDGVFLAESHGPYRISAEVGPDNIVSVQIVVDNVSL